MEYSKSLNKPVYVYIHVPKMASLHAIRARETDDELYQLIEREPGLSKYELKNELKWSMGKTDGSIKRLLESGRIFVKVVERDGRQVHLIYPVDMKPTDVIKIPKQELETHNPLWFDKALVYALDSETIGVAGQHFDEWSEISRFEKEIPLNHEDDQVSFEIPEEFKTFYQLDRKHYVVSINANNVLITVSGEIIKG